MGGGACPDNTTQPARPVTRNSLRPCSCGLIRVYYLSVSFFLLLPPFLCVAWSCAVVDKKEQTNALDFIIVKNLTTCIALICWLYQGKSYKA
jgi:hypothetical protein